LFHTYTIIVLLHSHQKLIVIQKQILKKLILLVIFNFQMFISVIHLDQMFLHSMVFHLMLNMVKLLLLLVHLVRENQHVFNYYKDFMIYNQVQFILMENKLINII
jgi:hypothetical protein